jgi:hypothetical protein
MAATEKVASGSNWHVPVWTAAIREYIMIEIYWE